MIAFIRCSTTIKVTPRALTARSSSSASSTSDALSPAITSSSKQQIGIERKRLGDLEPLAIGDRQIARGPPGDPREPDDFEQLVGAPKASRALRFAPSLPYIAPTATFSRTLRFANGLTI
jgi:hypothetical protein